MKVMTVQQLLAHLQTTGLGWIVDIYSQNYLLFTKLNFYNTKLLRDYNESFWTRALFLVWKTNDPDEQETQDQLLESITLKVKREKASIISLLGSKGIAIGEPIWLNVRPRRRRHYYKWLLTAILDSSQLTYSNKM